jgi:hypothetical protein
MYLNLQLQITIPVCVKNYGNVSLDVTTNDTDPNQNINKDL